MRRAFLIQVSLKMKKNPIKERLFFVLLILNFVGFSACSNSNPDQQKNLLSSKQVEEFKQFLTPYLKVNDQFDSLDVSSLSWQNEIPEVGYKKYTSKTFVFEVSKLFPGVIFKYADRKADADPNKGVNRGKSYNRKENWPKIFEILRNNSFDALKLPEYQYFEFPYDKFIVEIFVEEKFDIKTPDGKFPDWSKNGYSYFFEKLDKNPKAIRNMKEILYQLTGLICKTGFWDIQPPNIPLQFENQIPDKLILVDTNDFFNYRKRSDYDMLKESQQGVRRLLLWIIAEINKKEGGTAGRALALEVKAAYESFCGGSIDSLGPDVDTSYRYLTFEEYLSDKFPNSP
jgi:hypothetical protein